jgi:hypothetical protein
MDLSSALHGNFDSLFATAAQAQQMRVLGADRRRTQRVEL